VDIAYDGEEGYFLGDAEPYDAIILDLGLPKLDGLSVLQQWRASGSKVPVLILTSRDTWREKVIGLQAGADDYLSKPFEFEELLARLEALIRSQ
jgi:two-component system OmpR family response regulator